MITLKSSDHEIFEVEEAVAAQLEILSGLIKDDCADSTIPLQNVTDRILGKVIEYCKKHAEVAGRKGSKFSAVEKTNELNKFDKDFMNVDKALLFDLMLVGFLPEF